MCSRRGAVFVELAREFDRVLERELGTRADREVRGVHRVAHQHDMAAAVEVRPLLALDTLEVEPGGAAQMARIGHQLRALQVVGEEPFAERDRLVLVGTIEAVRLPDRFGRLDDEGRRRLVELVDVCLEPAVFGLFEQEREGVVELVGAQPDVAIGPVDDVGLEDRDVLVADARVDAVRGDDQIGVGVLVSRRHLALEDELDAEDLAARLEDVEQLLAPDADEAVPATADRAALEVQLDVVPVVERMLDRRGRRRVPHAHVVHRRVRQHDAPAEGVVGEVALDHRDVVRRILLLHQQREIEAGGASADADDLHGVRP